jgi:hypothetical protein
MPHTESRDNQPRKWTPKGIRFATTLTEPLLLELCEKHYEGRDFRTRTALRCGVGPDRLQHWLEVGSRDPESDSLQARLFREFSRIEAEIAAEYIAEVANPEVETEESFFDDEGNLTSKTRRKRSTAGVQWLLQVRFAQFKPDHTLRPVDKPVEDLLQKQTGTLSLEAAMAIVTQLASSMPEQLLPIFTSAGWTPPAKALTHGSNPASEADDTDDDSEE